MKFSPDSIEKLRWIMSQLRHPETGCPWDKKQTFSSIVPHTIEEAYEVADAIERGDFNALPAELGDLLFQVIFYCQLAQEQKIFTFDDVISAICEKLIRRHPHVFGEAKFNDEAQIKQNWENEKIKERAALAGIDRQPSLLDDIPVHLPALAQAQKIQKRCAHVGFDMPELTDVVDKIEEELAEVKAELPQNQQPASVHLAEELGDLLFAVVNLARRTGFDAETLLRQANKKFSQRFKKVEKLAHQHGKDLSETQIEVLESWWQQVKSEESAID
jgi:ATP diphosphatase